MRWLLLLCLAGCQDVFGCGAPDDVEYKCQPVASGSPGCVGGPTIYDGAGHPVVLDADKTFPFGCIASLPQCYEDGSGAEGAICLQSGDTGEWDIPQ